MPSPVAPRGEPPDGMPSVPGLLSAMNSRRNVSPANVHPRPPTQEQIAALAHELWRERGCPEGSDIDIWLDAERQLNGELSPRTERDPIPADPDRADADSDPALHPELDREIGNVGGPGQERSPTSFQL